MIETQEILNALETLLSGEIVGSEDKVSETKELIRKCMQLLLDCSEEDEKIMCQSLDATLQLHLKKLDRVTVEEELHSQL